MPTALDGLRVVDFSDSLAGQYCARLLADFGADVTLIEPVEGSAIRRMQPFSVTEPNLSLHFWHLNAGKRSIVVDRADAERRDAMLAAADVAILPEDFDPQRVERLNPGCIAASVSAFGRDGPLEDWRGPEIVLQALSGMMNNNGAYGHEPLYGVGNRASYAAGLATCIGILVALHERHSSNLGQVVSVDAAETAAAMCFPYVMRHIYNGSIHTRQDQTIPAGQVKCRDGWVCIWIYNHRWHAVCTALDLPHLENDPRFAEPAVRRANWETLYEIIQEKVTDQCAEELVERLQKAQVIAAKAYRPSEQLQNGHLNDRNYWEKADGRLILGTPYRMSVTPRKVASGAPALGEANGKIAWTPPERIPPRQSSPRLPLEGLRVIEITTAWAGPMAGRVLAYFGAQSIHVESPNRVNSWRLNREKPNPINFPDGEAGSRPFDRSFLFNSQNVNKLSCILNLKTEEGRKTLRRLVAVADVLICNFRPGTLAKLGLDYESLAAIKSDIIVAELPAFGGRGPMSSYAALGPTMEMATGMSAMMGYPGGQPENSGPSYLDPIGGFNAAAAILMALYHRDRTGEGQYIEVPQVEAAMQFIGAELLLAAETGGDPPPDGNRVLHMAPHDAFPARGEDQWVVIAAEDHRQWVALCAAMGRPELASDPRFSDLAARKRNEAELTSIICEWTAIRDKHAVARLLQYAGVAAAPVANAADVAASTYLAYRGFFTELDHPDAGRHRHPGLPIHLSRTPGSQRRAAPQFGGHNQHVLRHILAFSACDIDRISKSDAMAAVPFPDG
ncbi:crotonobetainyl-CoA:carnitine CoA-transferase CaiB-like acyl-CoA transferase [Rhizobium petrolearium]|uniref:CaiB/BaiF CoA transferase family protein n=1 Tax=Neorhizobium petrolearium TaxID=515361 RepID=UPI001AE12BB4|nr:CoA transferase [Neorhizobium petrolearium]MBP1842836.1 crotonobetainyl-CoA:carnitine CoA-transferase CaiB-like acyl-CoA transferase [Neorhizobium petrolearium]